MKYLVIVLLLGLISSCNVNNSDSLSKVEEMQKKASSLKESFDSVDYNELKKAKKQYDESLFLVKKYYFKDTIDSKFMNGLDYYKSIKYATKTMTKNKLVISDNIGIVEDQLTNLKNDIENNSIEGDRLKEALINESQNIAKLDSSISEYLLDAKRIITVHDSIASYIKAQTLSF